ncbi:MAG: single-strand DNA-binding protein [Hyphomicrobiaceae bacterium]|jgi:single-strand DNA-binding protein
MASLNKVMIIGNLGQDPELRHTGSGQAVCSLRLATNEVWTDKAGERQERTEWHSVVVWGRQGENCAQYLEKGRSCYVEGRLQTRKWQDKEGKDRYTTEIIGDRIQFLSGGQGGGQGGGQSGGGAGGGGGGGRDDNYGGGGGGGGGRSDDFSPPAPADDDIPF